MDIKVQGSRSGKALGIGELLASACTLAALVLRWIDHRYHSIIRRRKTRAAVLNGTDHKIMPGS